MEEQPSFEPEPQAPARRRERVVDFIRRVVIVQAVSAGAAAVYMLLIGPRDLIGFSNGLFFAGAILLLVALFPVLSGVFGRATVSFRVEEGDFEEVLEEERVRSRQGDTLSFVFGTSGILTVALSLVTSLAVN